MSLFGFDTTLPRDRGHNTRAPGFGHSLDPFASLSQGQNAENDALDFEETYDGLGDQLDETEDAFNVDTFGGNEMGGAPVGKDFDFFGQTARIADRLQQEQMYTGERPSTKFIPQKASVKPVRTGYENYREPGYVPSLEASASIWGTGSTKQTPEPTIDQREPTAAASRKMMSLEEVEASMRAQQQKARTPQPTQIQEASLPQPQRYEQEQYLEVAQSSTGAFTGPSQIVQQPPHMQELTPPAQRPSSQHGAALGFTPQILQRQQPLPFSPPAQAITANEPSVQNSAAQPRQTLQHSDSISHQQGYGLVGRGTPLDRGGHGAPFAGILDRLGNVITHPEQLTQLTDEQRLAFLAEDARRAKRNHKIAMLARGNGIMTPQDKNFITRIQLQQLMTATGNVDEQGPEAANKEDFYYQVYKERATGRPGQPLNDFAQTYLFQTGGRGARGTNRLGDNHMQRMQQQVQRAVEAAKLKPKNKQLVIEGSLGKISFSNAKTPKPLLNMKRQDSGDVRPRKAPTIADRKATLRDIENLYSTLLQLELECKEPPPPQEGDERSIRTHMEWTVEKQGLRAQLWRQMKVLDPINPNSTVPHPFIAILSHSKGKKLLPRVWNYLDDQQRLTILTILYIQLDWLDVIRLAVPANPLESPALSTHLRDEIALCFHTVIELISAYLAEAPLNIISGLAGLTVDRVNVVNVIRTRVGIEFIRMIISRAQNLLEAQAAPESDLAQWDLVFSQLFDIMEPVLTYVFPRIPVTSSEDVYVWQFLASIGAQSSPEQQGRLVVAVKERVMDTVQTARTLPEDLAMRRLADVNLFMNAIGLDTDMLG